MLRYIVVYVYMYEWDWMKNDRLLWGNRLWAHRIECILISLKYKWKLWKWLSYTTDTMTSTELYFSCSVEALVPVTICLKIYLKRETEPNVIRFVCSSKLEWGNKIFIFFVSFSLFWGIKLIIFQFPYADMLG